MIWYSHLFKNFPQFVVIHIIKGFGIVNKAEVEVFLELSCFFDDPTSVGNLIVRRYPVFLPGESQRWRSLVGCYLWGHTESEMAEVTAAAADEQKSVLGCKATKDRLTALSGANVAGGLKVSQRSTTILKILECLRI